MIPKSLQTYYEEQLHKGDPGIKTTKQRASEHVYWNKMYEHLDITVKKCAPCNALKPHQQKRRKYKYMKYLNSSDIYIYIYIYIYMCSILTKQSACRQK